VQEVRNPIVTGLGLQPQIIDIETIAFLEAAGILRHGLAMD